MWSVIPHAPVQDTLTFLMILLNIPPLISILVQLLYIQTSSSKQVISIFLFRSSKSSVKSSGTIIQNQPGKEKEYKESTGSGAGQSDQPGEEHENFITPLVVITIIDLALSLLFKFSFPNLHKLILLLANSIIAVSLSGFSYNYALLGSLSVIVLDFIFKNITYFLSKRSNLFVTTHHVFPLISNPNPIGLYRNVIHFVNLYLAIHILLIALCSVFRRNYIARQLQYLSNQKEDTHPQFPTSQPVSLLNNLQSNHVPEVPVPIEIAKSHVPYYVSNNIANNIYGESLYEDSNKHQHANESEEDSTHNNHDSPASYPRESETIFTPVSASQIVSENFSNFLNSPFLKSKNPAKSSQPLWSLIATIRAMSSRTDIYGGEVNIHDASQEQALVVNENLDYIKLSKDDHRSVGTFYVIYIGETIIAFLLNKKKEYASVIPSITTKVNGLIWYQISRAPLDEYEELYLVSGLTPLSHYDIQFILKLNNGVNILMDEFIVGTVDGEKIPVETNATETNVTSPLITLQESLVTTTENIGKEKLKLKKKRKETTKSLNALRTEIEKCREKIVNGGQPEANKRRLDQLRNQLSVLEAEVAVIEAEYLSLEEEEQNQTDIYNAEKPKFELSNRQHQTYRAAFDERIAKKQKIKEKLESEIESLQSKLSKAEAKVEKANLEFESLSKEIEEIVSTDTRNKLELREGRNAKRTLLLGEFKKEISVLERGMNSLTSENESLKNALAGVVINSGATPGSSGSGSGVGSSSVSINGVATNGGDSISGSNGSALN